MRMLLLLVPVVLVLRSKKLIKSMINLASTLKFLFILGCFISFFFWDILADAIIF